MDSPWRRLWRNYGQTFGSSSPTHFEGLGYSPTTPAQSATLQGLLPTTTSSKLGNVSPVEIPGRKLTGPTIPSHHVLGGRTRRLVSLAAGLEASEKGWRECQIPQGICQYETQLFENEKATKIERNHGGQHGPQ